MGGAVQSKLELILNHATDRLKASAKYSEEGNKYEFDTCDLLLKGAGGAFFLYFSLIQFDQASLRVEAIVYLSLSLIIGVWHKLDWSRKLLQLGREEVKAHAQIVSKVFETLDTSKTTEDCDLALDSLWKDILKEERDHLEYLNGKKKLVDLKNLQYLTPRKSYSQWPIYFQLLFILLGASSALGFSLCDWVRYLISLIV